MYAATYAKMIGTGDVHMAPTREPAATHPAYSRARWPSRVSLRLTRDMADKLAAAATADSAPIADVAREALAAGLDATIRRRRDARRRAIRDASRDDHRDDHRDGDAADGDS